MCRRPLLKLINAENFPHRFPVYLPKFGGGGNGPGRVDCKQVHEWLLSEYRVTSAAWVAIDPDSVNSPFAGRGFSSENVISRF